MLLMRHLREDRFSDIIIAAPVRCPFRIGELIEIMSAGFKSKALGYSVNRAGIINSVDFTTVEADRIQLGRSSCGRHDRNEAQAQHPSEISLADRCRARRRFDHAGVGTDPAVAQRIEEQ